MNPHDDFESVVQEQLDAYNARDIDRLMSTYSENARQFEHPATLIANGWAEIRHRSINRFKEPNLRALLLKRIVSGNIVIDHERVSRTFPEGTGTLELVAIYEVNTGKIDRAWFISGAKVIDFKH